jgi:hypothetical protein
MNDSLPHGLWRMDWGFGNPNKTATLIALIMIAVWILGYVRKWGFWAALTLFTGFGICLILTQSRGGLVGAIVGGLIVLAWALRPFPFWRFLAVIVACAVLAIFALVINAESRYVKGLSGKDQSVENRLLIWKQVLSMIHDAPNGWGLGKSGEAYMQWYQPVSRGEGYRTLVNSHLTWLTELNWLGRIGYVFSWAAVLVLLWPRRDCRWFSIPFATWIILGICASFSSVAEAPLLWVIPIMAFGSVLVVRYRRSLWPEAHFWIEGAVVSSAIIAIIWLGGTLLATPSIIHCSHEGMVTLGATSPKIWIVAPNRNVLGEHFGHEVRRGYEANAIYGQTGLGIVTLLKNAPTNQILVFSGQVPLSLEALHPTQVILINPKPVSTDVLQALLANPSITVVVGEFSRNKDYWNKQSREHPNIKVQLVAGSEEYIPNWMQEIANAIKG